MTAFALTPYPLSGTFRESLDLLAGESVEVILLTELRRLGPAGLARRLRSLHGRCFLPLEDGNTAAFLPILELLASASRAGSIETVDASLTPLRISRAHALRSPGIMAAATIDGQRALARARRGVARLLEESRAAFAVGTDPRVLYLNGNLWLGLKAGGSIAHTTGVVNGLSQLGYDVELAAVSVPAGLAETVRVTPLDPPTSFGLPLAANLFRWNESLPERLADVRSPSFVYQRHALGSFAGALLSRRLQRPLVLEYNGSELWIARNWGVPIRYEQLALQAEEASLRHAALIVTISAALRDDLLARGVEPDRIVLHPNGVDTEIFDPARFGDDAKALLRARYGIASDATVATFVGTFGQWHGAEVLARAIALLHGQRRDELEAARLHFMLVGDGLTLSEVRRLIAGHDQLVTIAGMVPQSETPLYLAASDILVSPHVPNPDGTPFFGSPTKLFEYMAAGKAIIASDLDQIGEVLRGDGAPIGVLVEPGSTAALADGLLRLAGDPEERRRLGATARQAAVSRYTWRQHVQAVLDGVGRLGT